MYAECKANTWATGGPTPASRRSCKHDDPLERLKHDAALVEFQMKEGVVEDYDLVTVTSQGWQAEGGRTPVDRIRIGVVQSIDTLVG